MNQIDPGSRHRVFQVGAVRYDEGMREVHVAGRRRSLEAKPLALLHALLVHAGAIVTKRDLIEAAWGNADHIAESSLTTAMSKLRTALGEQARDLIEVVHGSGYRIAAPVGVELVQARRGQPVPLAPGERVPGRPHWRLVRLLGEGTRNAWLAQHGKTREERVFKFALGLPELETLRQEANLSRVLHATLGQRDDLVRIVDWDFEHAPYFIESAYGGPSLTQWAAEGDTLAALGLEARLGLVAAIARTVAAAHAACVLHGDIKPANILVDRKDAGPPRLRLIDFGAGGLSDAAKLALLSIELTAPMTTIPARRGTIGYIAPEILAGAPLTTKADIYALGILAYQLAAGDLTLLPGVGWQDGIADPLLRDDIIAATATDPVLRLDSAAAFAQRLETLAERRAARMRHEDALRHAATLTRRAELARTRRPWIIAAALSLAITSIVLAVFTVHAERSRDEARRRAETAQAVNDFLTLDLLGRGDPGQSGKPDESLMDAAQAAERGIDRRLVHDKLVAGSIHLALARAFDSRSAFDAARHAYDQAGSAFAAAGDTPSEVITHLHQAIMELVCGQPGALARADTLLAAAEPRIATLGPRHEEATIWLLAGQSLRHSYNGEMEAAKAGFERALARADLMPDVIDLATRLALRRRLDFIYARMGQWQQAGKLLTALLSQELALHGPRDPETLHVQLNLVEVLLGSGRAAEAEAAAEQLYPVFVAVLGPDHRLTLDLQAIRAAALVGLERYGEALQIQMAAYQSGVRTFGARSATPFWSLTSAAQIQCRAGQIEAGLATARTAFERARVEGRGLHDAAAGNLAFCLIAAKDYTQAAAYLEQIGPVPVAQSRGDPEDEAMIALMRAEVAFARGDAAGGKQALAGAAPVFERPGADAYLRRWSRRLVAAAGPVGP